MINYKEIQDKYEFEVYPKRDICIIKGKDAKLWDDKGNEYIDCIAGMGVASVGHSNTEVADAIAEQAHTLITCPGVFYNDKRAQFMEKLVSLTSPELTKVFMTNSGTEAVEGALKAARLTTGKTDFIAAMKGFHGRSMGALSATFKKTYREPFNPLVPGFSFVPFNNFEKMAEAVTDKTAGIIIEPVQGEGGINIANNEYIKNVRRLCNQKNIIFILDEIQSGFCRTGKMFAHQHFDVKPDILTLAKAIGGGFPLGAFVCNNKIASMLGKHGTTFGGNPLASAAGFAALKFMTDNNLAEMAREKGKYFVSKFKNIELTKVREIRHLGLMIGIELKQKVKPILEELMKEGILALPAGTTVLRLLPPLVIGYDELDIVAEKLIKVLKD